MSLTSARIRSGASCGVSCAYVDDIEDAAENGEHGHCERDDFELVEHNCLERFLGHAEDEEENEEHEYH